MIGRAMAGLVAGLAIFTAPASADVQTKDCGAGNRIVYDGPTKMWPPNHSYWPLTIRAKAFWGFTTVALSSSGVHDEAGMNGAGNTPDDVAPASDSDYGWGSALTAHQIRAERAGKGDGRVYTITANATFWTGPCTATFTAVVPHDRGKPKRRRR